MGKIIAALFAVGVFLLGATSLFAAGPEQKWDRDKVQDRIVASARTNVTAAKLRIKTRNKVIERFLFIIALPTMTVHQ
ncbi:MAG: hypothetical protein ACLP5H_32795 [Desulfomonilaceae bacterium]